MLTLARRFLSPAWTLTSLAGRQTLQRCRRWCRRTSQPSSVINPSSGKLTAHVTALGLAIARDSSELTRLILQNGGAARLETRTLTPLNDVESR